MLSVVTLNVIHVEFCRAKCRYISDIYAKYCHAECHLC
jgi:hypothetical protein